MAEHGIAVQEKFKSDQDERGGKIMAGEMTLDATRIMIEDDRPELIDEYVGFRSYTKEAKDRRTTLFI
jgi:peroxiredoxin family protein